MTGCVCLPIRCKMGLVRDQERAVKYRREGEEFWTGQKFSIRWQVLLLPVVVSWYPAVTLPIRFWLLRCRSDHLHAKATAALSARSHSAGPSSCGSWLQSPSLLRHLHYKWQPVSHPHCLWGFPVHFCLARIVFAWFQLQIH